MSKGEQPEPPVKAPNSTLSEKGSEVSKTVGMLA